MKKIFVIIFLILFFLNSSYSQKKYSSIQVVINAEKILEIPIYKIKDNKEDYVLLKDLAKIFSATLTYHSVGKYVSFNCRGEKIYFYFNRNYLIWSNQKISLNSEVLNINNKTYVPLSLFNNSAFNKILNVDVEYRKSENLLLVNYADNISVSYYITPNFANIEFKYPEGLQYEYNYENNFIVLTFFGGKAQAKEYKVVDGLVPKIQIFSQNGECIAKIFIPDLDIEIKKESYKGKVVLKINKTNIKKTSLAKSNSVDKTTYVVTSAKTLDKNERKIIVLDPGHGGEDPGAIGKYGNKEKDINLKIAKLLKEKLEQDGFVVFLTREDDIFIPLVKRTEFANNKNADIFISIHCNAAEKPNGTDLGFEIYFLSETATDPDAVATEKLENEVVRFEKQTEELTKLQKILWSMIVNEFINESSKLCSLIGNEVVARTQQIYRGVKQAGFYVLRGAQMPAVLVECGFISNPKEELKLINPQFQNLIADGIYAGIKRYYENGK